MAEIVIVGGSDFAMGFYLTGLKRIYEIKDMSQSEKMFRELSLDPTVGIIVTDARTISSLPKDYRRKIETATKPIIITLSKEGGEEENLREMIKKSIGVDLWVS